MKTYLNLRFCPKCRNDVYLFSTVFHHIDGSFCNSTVFVPEPLLPEHMHRICDKCYYEWMEAPFDAVEE